MHWPYPHPSPPPAHHYFPPSALAKILQSLMVAHTNGKFSRNTSGKDAFASSVTFSASRADTTSPPAFDIKFISTNAFFTQLISATTQCWLDNHIMVHSSISLLLLQERRE